MAATEIIKIYDNGGETLDRYTVVFLPLVSEHNKNFYESRDMSSDCDSPQGFCQWGYACLGDHLGKEISLKDLPEACVRQIIYDLYHA